MISPAIETSPDTLTIKYKDPSVGGPGKKA